MIRGTAQGFALKTATTETGWCPTAATAFTKY